MNSKICRLCLTENASIYIFDNVLEFMMSHCQVNVRKNDGLPENICLTCTLKVQDVSKFIEQCCENEKILQQKLKEGYSFIENDKNTVHNAAAIDIKNENTLSSTFEETTSFDVGDSELIKSIQVAENGEEYLYYLGIKIIVNRQREIEPKERKSVENGVGNKKRSRKTEKKLCHICGNSSGNKHKYCHIDKSIKCDLCDKVFKSKWCIQKHMICHSDRRPYPCTICNKAYKTGTQLRKHRKYVHAESLVLLPCSLCSNRYKTPAQLKRHLDIHCGKKKYQCDYCKKQFSWKQSLEGHIRTHTGDRPFSCKVCKKSFASTRTLEDHVRLHSGERPFKCPLCNKGFAQSGNMKSHFRHNHKNEKFEYITPRRKQLSKLTIPKK